MDRSSAAVTSSWPSPRTPPSHQRNLPVTSAWCHEYPNIAQAHFDARGIQVEIVKLNGNIEPALLIGIADVVVDITALLRDTPDRRRCTPQHRTLCRQPPLDRA